MRAVQSPYGCWLGSQATSRGAPQPRGYQWQLCNARRPKEGAQSHRRAEANVQGEVTEHAEETQLDTVSAKVSQVMQRGRTGPCRIGAKYKKGAQPSHTTEDR